jgi:hypothetical protein
MPSYLKSVSRSSDQKIQIVRLVINITAGRESDTLRECGTQARTDAGGVASDRLWGIGLIELTVIGSGQGVGCEFEGKVRGARTLN